MLYSLKSDLLAKSHAYILLIVAVQLVEMREEGEVEGEGERERERREREREREKPLMPPPVTVEYSLHVDKT